MKSRLVQPNHSQRVLRQAAKAWILALVLACSCAQPDQAAEHHFEAPTASAPQKVESTERKTAAKPKDSEGIDIGFGTGRPESPAEGATSASSADGQHQYVDNILEQLKFASIAFNTPDRVDIDDTAVIRLSLSVVETVEEIKQSLAERGEVGEVIGTQIRVSNRMGANLKGSSFKITPITPEVQAISTSERTEWKWEVSPKRKGKHNLHLTIYALVEVDGVITPRQVKVYEKAIVVQVPIGYSIKTFVANNWQWLWMSILLPVGGFVWKRRRKILELAEEDDEENDNEAEET